MLFSTIFLFMSEYKIQILVCLIAVVMFINISTYVHLLFLMPCEYLGYDDKLWLLYILIN